MTDNIEIRSASHCVQNPGPGGYAAIVRNNETTYQVAGRDTKTTSHRTAMLASLEALKTLPEGSLVTVYTSSSELSKAITQGWTKQWQSNGWFTGKSPHQVKDHDLWEELLKLCEKRTVEWKTTSTSDQHQDTLLCNRTARKQADKARKDLKEIQTRKIQ